MRCTWRPSRASRAWAPTTGWWPAAAPKPLLANDPHLKLTAPALWYFARLDAPGFKVAGATMPGLPGVVLGQNEHIAWGFTNTGPDVQDVYIERINPADPGQYQTPDGWARFSAVTETIKVRGAPDVTLVARTTRHGPVISDVNGGAEGLTAPGSQGATASISRRMRTERRSSPGVASPLAR